MAGERQARNTRSVSFRLDDRLRFNGRDLGPGVNNLRDFDFLFDVPGRV